MKRFCQRAYLKPEKIEDYRKLHAAVWPSVLAEITKYHLHNYTIWIMGDMVVAYFEYTGEDYEADMAEMDQSEAMHEWWKFSKPCFRGHENAVYYEDMEQIFLTE